MASHRIVEMRPRLRIAVVQFTPKIGEVQQNIARASKLCSELRPNSVDLVCFPEMIFSGYVFSDADHIAPYLEEPKKGPTSRFCAQLAKQLHCYVAAGYPERLAPHEHLTATLENAQTIQQVGANSAVVYDPQGNCLANYRKTNLFHTDMPWARPGTGFMTLYLPPPLKTVCLGICMDLNPQPPADWTLEDGPYEIADYCVEQNADVLILLNAWLDSQDEPQEDRDWRTLNYWAARLRPLYTEQDQRLCSGFEDRQALQAQTKETLAIICNRTGKENGETFAGTSALFSLQWGSGRPRLLHALGRRTEGIAVWVV